MHNHIKISGLTIILVMVITGMLFGNGLPKNKIRDAQNFSLSTIDGQLVQLSDYKGKIVLINFWAAWCAPCLREMPVLERLYKDLSDDGFQVIGIAIVSKFEDIPKKVSETGVTYPVVIGDKQLIEDYGFFTSIPQTFLIDREGKIVKEFSGSTDPSILTREIKTILFE